MKNQTYYTAAILITSSLAYANYNSVPKKDSCAFEQGYGLCNNTYPAAYNAPARIDVQNSWDIFATGSFIYWHVNQESMEIALPATSLSASVISQGEFLTQNFKYKPGFKVGLGINFGHDNWVGYMEYTRLHQTTTTPLTNIPSNAELWNSAFWFNLPQNNPTIVGSKWRINIDIGDVTFNRPFYQGSKLTILPFGGLRGIWIHQNMKVQSFEDSVLAESKNYSHNWAVGVRGGLQAHWLLGCGFRFEGNAATSLLYTRFTKVNHTETSGALDSFKNYNTVRPMAELAAGLGWGCYTAQQEYHIDLSATYDFNVMWEQNMLSKVASYSTYFGFAPEAASLYLHGLTATARFDF